MPDNAETSETGATTHAVADAEIHAPEAGQMIIPSSIAVLLVAAAALDGSPAATAAISLGLLAVLLAAAALAAVRA